MPLCWPKWRELTRRRRPGSMCNDIGRQIRALEVHAATGRTLTELHAENQARQTARKRHCSSV